MPVIAKKTRNPTANQADRPGEIVQFRPVFYNKNIYFTSTKKPPPRPDIQVHPEVFPLPPRPDNSVYQRVFSTAAQAGHPSPSRSFSTAAQAGQSSLSTSFFHRCPVRTTKSIKEFSGRRPGQTTESIHEFYSHFPSRRDMSTYFHTRPSQQLNSFTRVCCKFTT